MDRSRFGGSDVTFVASPDAARAAAPTLLMVDIDRFDDLGAFRLDGCRVIGFGSHVDTDRHDRARTAGFDEVLPRSVFFRRLPEFLGGTDA